ncbi:MAG TPA: hypothetical protein VGK73_27700 [Polyangiaceae bacterium]
MIDESAFGLLIAYFNLEDDEYAGEREDFVARYAAFATCLRERLVETPPGSSGRVLDLGHAVYIELDEDDAAQNLIAWLRDARSALRERDYETAAVLTFGATWVDANEPRPDVAAEGAFRFVRASLPSEPLRRALLAEAATHGDEESGVEGWGPGLYLDVEATEALGRKPKNEPTILRAGGARFYRGGS